MSVSRVNYSSIVSNNLIECEKQRDHETIVNFTMQIRDYISDSLTPLVENFELSEDGFNQVSFKFQFLADLFRKLEGDTRILAIKYLKSEQELRQ